MKETAFNVVLFLSAVSQ